MSTPEICESTEIPSQCMSRFWIKQLSETAIQLGFKSSDKTGKWCILVSEKTVDKKWLCIKKAVENNLLLCAKVTTKKYQSYRKVYAICVYTQDWSNMNDLKNTREILRTLGFKRPLKYKRDLETINRVYNKKKQYFLTL